MWNLEAANADNLTMAYLAIDAGRTFKSGGQKFVVHLCRDD